MVIRKRVILWIAAAFFIAAIGEGLSIWISSTAIACHDQTYSQDNAGAGQDNCPLLYRAIVIDTRPVRRGISDFVTDNHDAISALATAFIALFTFILWRFTSKLWRASERQLKATTTAAEAAQKAANVAEHALTIGQRAFVFFNGVRPNCFLNQKTGGVAAWSIAAIFENSGDTPTKHMIGRVNSGFFDDELPYDFDFSDSRREGDWSAKKIPILLAPKSTITFGGSVFIPLEKMMEIAFNKGPPKSTFYLWGWIDYNDVFPNTPRHRTEFCIRLIVEGDPSIGPKGCRITTRYHPKHNAADDDCMRSPEPYEPPGRASIGIGLREPASELKVD